MFTHNLPPLKEKTTKPVKKEKEETKKEEFLEEEVVGNEFIPKRIHINRQLATIQVASTGHEYIHALLSKYKGFLKSDIFITLKMLCSI